MILIADSGSTKTDWCIVSTMHQSNELERKESIPSSNQKKRFNKS